MQMEYLAGAQVINIVVARTQELARAAAMN